MSGLATDRYWPRLFALAAPRPGSPSTNFLQLRAIRPVRRHARVVRNIAGTRHVDCRLSDVAAGSQRGDRVARSSNGPNQVLEIGRSLLAFLLGDYALEALCGSFQLLLVASLNPDAIVAIARGCRDARGRTGEQDDHQYRRQQKPRSHSPWDCPLSCADFLRTGHRIVGAAVLVHGAPPCLHRLGRLRMRLGCLTLWCGGESSVAHTRIGS